MINLGYVWEALLVLLQQEKWHPVYIQSWVQKQSQQLAKIATKPWFEKKVKFYHELIPKAALAKRILSGNNTKATKVWENVVQTSVGGEFWACYVIMRRAYSFVYSLGLIFKSNFFSRCKYFIQQMKLKLQYTARFFLPPTSTQLANSSVRAVLCNNWRFHSAFLFWFQIDAMDNCQMILINSSYQLTRFVFSVLRTLNKVLLLL